MNCLRLKQLYQIVQTGELAFGPSDLIRLACQKCQETEVCPAMSSNEYGTRQKRLVMLETEI